MLGMGYFVSTLRNKTTNQRPTFIAVYTRYGILYLSFKMDTSAAYNDEQRRVPMKDKHWFSFRAETHLSTANAHAALTFSTLGR